MPSPICAVASAALSNVTSPCTIAFPNDSIGDQKSFILETIGCVLEASLICKICAAATSSSFTSSNEIRPEISRLSKVFASTSD